MGKIQTKVEPIGNDVYYVFAMPIEIDGMSYSLECLTPIRSEDINGIESEHVLNQLLVRNRQVYMDSATRVYNRRYYDERVRNLSGEYALAMIDIDNFKKINDRFGHTAGDAALYYVAQTIRSMLVEMSFSCCLIICRSRFWNESWRSSAERCVRLRWRSIRS